MHCIRVCAESPGFSLLASFYLLESERNPQQALVMNKQTDEEILTYDVSDEALEAAGAAMAGGAVTLIQGSYCFTCAHEAQQVAST